MINLKLIETNFDEFNKKLIAKKVPPQTLQTLLDAYNELKSKKTELENLQAVQNAKSKELGLAAREGKDVGALKSQLEKNKQKIQNLSELVNEREQSLEAIAACVPNIIDDDVPIGADENENVCIKKVLDPRTFDFASSARRWDGLISSAASNSAAAALPRSEVLARS